MSDKLQELTEKLYHEGVEKAQVEADHIIADATKRSVELIESATAEASALVEKGRKDAAQLLARGEAELNLAAKQAELALKQRLVNMLSDRVLSKAVGSVLTEELFLKNIILKLVTNFTDTTASPEVKLVLNETEQESLKEALHKELAREMSDGLVIEFSDRVKAGFRVEAKDGSYALSFTDKDFEEYFRSFIKNQIRSILFTEA